MISLERKLLLRGQAAMVRDARRVGEAVGRMSQVVYSSVPVGGEDVPLVGAVQDASDAAAVLPGLEDGTALAGDDAWIAWDQSEYAKGLAEQLDEELTTAQVELARALTEAEEALTEAGLARSEAAVAVADAQAAVAEAGTALSEAIAAAQAASDASVQAKLADGRLTMSGKAPVAADGVGKPVGAVWMRQMAGAVTAMWEWTALGWVSRPLAEQIIPKVAIGEGTYGELAGGRIKARSITADRVLIAGGGNHIDNPSFLGGDGWALDSGVSIVADSTEGNYLSFTGTGSTGALNSAILDVEPGDEVLFEAEVWSPGGFTGNAGGLRAYRYTVDGQSVAMTVLNFSPSVTPQKAAASYVIPEGVCQIQFRFATAITGGEVRVRKPRVRVKSAGELIVDGSILAQHLEALTVSAEKLAANAVTAVKIAAGAVTAEKIMAGAVTTVKLDALAVTAAKIAAGAIIADKIAAGAITTAKLSATAIDGMTITGALIRTATSGQRMEFTVHGLRAIASNGSVTASISSASGGMLISGPLLSQGAGVSTTIRPEHFQMATDAVGAASKATIMSPGSVAVTANDRNRAASLTADGDAPRLSLSYLPNGGSGTAFEISQRLDKSTKVYSPGRIDVWADEAEGVEFFAPVRFYGDTDWVDCIFQPGNTSPANRRLQVIRMGRKAYLRGAVMKSSGNIPATTYSHMANLPDERFFPAAGAPSAFPPVGAAGATPAFTSINTAGAVQVYPSAAVGWIDFAGVSWFVD